MDIGQDKSRSQRLVPFLYPDSQTNMTVDEAGQIRNLIGAVAPQNYCFTKKMLASRRVRDKQKKLFVFITLPQCVLFISWLLSYC